jgi:hypothetical protein
MDDGPIAGSHTALILHAVAKEGRNWLRTTERLVHRQRTNILQITVICRLCGRCAQTVDSLTMEVLYQLS